jgi:hypothetical protein
MFFGNYMVQNAQKLSKPFGCYKGRGTDSGAERRKQERLVSAFALKAEVPNTQFGKCNSKKNYFFCFKQACLASSGAFDCFLFRLS